MTTTTTGTGAASVRDEADVLERLRNLRSTKKVVRSLVSQIRCGQSQMRREQRGRAMRELKKLSRLLESLTQEASTLSTCDMATVTDTDSRRDCGINRAFRVSRSTTT